MIMDVSGSMKRKDPSGTTLIDGARKAIAQLTDEVPADARIGLRLYGNKYAGDDKTKGCVDTELAVPIGEATTTADRIGQAINKAKPTGFTPIGKALTDAAGDFGSDVERSIVLVSDGEDTCGNPAPCAAAKQLASKGIKVRVDTVGLFLRGNARATKQLQCIAEVTGGAYVAADNTATLADELTTVSSRAIQRQVLDGEDVDGGPALVSATPIEVGTTYVDDLVKGEAKWYSFEVKDGQRLKLTATDDGTTPYGCCLSYALMNPDGDRIQGDHGYNSNSANTYILQTSESEAEYTEAGTYFVKAELNDRTSDEDYPEMPFQFVVETTGPSAEESASASASPTAETSATPDTAASDADTTKSDEESGNGFLWALVGILTLAVLGLGGAVAVLLRRTRPSKD